MKKIKSIATEIVVGDAYRRFSLQIFFIKCPLLKGVFQFRVHQ